MGCSQEEQKDQNIELIESFLEYDLIAPNEEAIQANDELWKWLEKNDDGTPSEEYESFLKETYGTYLTESGLEHFKTTGQVGLSTLNCTKVLRSACVCSCDLTASLYGHDFRARTPA
ncbi:hypothetical protein, partial [Sporosarcina sp. USHLN248]|uniref:hypothetical protein n=1 Tax=Sporosarcina sp. USHLN248 TaxID=3081300 RepID=UPI0030175696